LLARTQCLDDRHALWQWSSSRCCVCAGLSPTSAGLTVYRFAAGHNAFRPHRFALFIGLIAHAHAHAHAQYMPQFATACTSACATPASFIARTRGMATQESLHSRYIARGRALCLMCTPPLLLCGPAAGEKTAEVTEDAAVHGGPSFDAHLAML